jgi:molybdopterin synthase catalytic subunit
VAVYARLRADSFDPGLELGRFTSKLSGDGAVVSFVGLARNRTRDGAEVTGLFLDHHPRLTQISLDKIAQAAAARLSVGTVLVIHRCGAIEPGEPIVFVAAASAHRRAAFEAVDYMMDRLKTDAMFWKREDAVDGSRWIEPTDGDRADRARWSDDAGDR